MFLRFKQKIILSWKIDFPDNQVNMKEDKLFFFKYYYEILKPILATLLEITLNGIILVYVRSLYRGWGVVYICEVSGKLKAAVIN